MNNQVIDITVNKLGKTYWLPKEKKELKVLDDLTFNVERGEFFCLVGPSGCGKTTLLRILLDIEEGWDGDFNLNLAKSIPDVVEYGVAYIQQMPQLLPWRNLLQNVTLCRETKGRIAWPDKQGILELIEEYGLRGYEHFLPAQLSGGMSQRVAVMRALAYRPQILFCDEPFSSIDFVTRLHLLGVFKRNCIEGNVTTIFVTHNIDEAIFLGTHVAVLSDRPARIIEIHDTGHIGSMDAVATREEQGFRKCFKKIWEQLGHDK